MAHRRRRLHLALVGAAATLTALVGGWAWVVGTVYAGFGRPLPPARVPDGLTDLSAASCRPCHPTQWSDWSSTRMAGAMRDVVFLADFHEQGEPYLCRTCHSPLHEQQPELVVGLWWVLPLVPRAEPNPDFRPELVDEGVTCVACHLREGALVAARPPTGTAPHAVVVDPALRSATTCAPCHQLPAPPLTRLDRDLMDTFEEWTVWGRLTGDERSCVDCHMPGGRHLWRGAWDPETLRAGLEVEVTVEGDEVVVTLGNLAGHHFPTGDPVRALVVRVGASEVVIARRVPVPSFVEAGDDTLAPAERRELRLPRAGATEVVVAMEPVRFLEVAQPAVVEIARLPLPPR